MMERIYTSGHQIQTLTKTPNGMGGFTESWATVSTVDGYLRTLIGSERLAADKVTLYATHRFYCAPVSVSESQRFVSGGKIYNIVLPDRKTAGNIDYKQLDLLYSGDTT